MQVGDKIYHYEVKIDFKKQSVKQDKNEYKLIGLNENYGVIDDYWFTKSKLNKKVGYTSDSIFDVAGAYEIKLVGMNEVHGYIYSTIENDKKMYSKVKKVIESLIDEKYGFYLDGKSLTSQIICQ